jgi:hypothetical protein
MDKEVEMWIRRAKSSLIRSRMIKTEDIFYEDLCFDVSYTNPGASSLIFVFGKVTANCLNP